MAASKAFKVGDLVWAKIKGYPHWPARIDEPQPGQKVPQRKYLIFFFGTHEVGFVKADDLFPFQEYKSKYFITSKKNRGFAEALVEVIENPTVKHTVEEEDDEEEVQEDDDDASIEEKIEEPENELIASNEEDDFIQEKKSNKKDEKEEVEKKKKGRKPKDKDIAKASKDKDIKPKKKPKEERKEEKRERRAKRQLNKKKKRFSSSIVPESSEEENSESDDEKLHIDVKNEEKEVSTSGHSSESDEPAPKKKKMSTGDSKSKGHKKSVDKTPKRKKASAKEEHVDKTTEDTGEKKEKESKDAEEQKRVLQEKLKEILEEKHEKEKQKELEKQRKEEEKQKRREERRKSKEEKIGKQRDGKKQRKKEEKAREKAEEREERERQEEVDKLRREEEARLAYERLAQESQGDEVAISSERNGQNNGDDDERQQHQGTTRKPKELSTQERLEELNDRLKLSLSLANPDPSKCMKIMQEISELPITPEIIKHSRNIVQTLKKVRYYKGNQKVSLKAATLYGHLKSKFVLAGSGMTTQLLKPPTNAILQPLPPKSGITPVHREEASANETVVEEAVRTCNSTDKTEIQEEEVSSSNINNTREEHKNGHCGGDVEESSEANKKLEGVSEESQGMEEVDGSVPPKPASEKTSDRSLACVDMEIDDDDGGLSEGDSKAPTGPKERNEQNEVNSSFSSSNQNIDVSL